MNPLKREPPSSPHPPAKRAKKAKKELVEPQLVEKMAALSLHDQQCTTSDALSGAMHEHHPSNQEQQDEPGIIGGMQDEIEALVAVERCEEGLGITVMCPCGKTYKSVLWGEISSASAISKITVSNAVLLRLDEQEVVTVERSVEGLAVQFHCPCSKTFKILLWADISRPISAISSGSNAEVVVTVERSGAGLGLRVKCPCSKTSKFLLWGGVSAVSAIRKLSVMGAYVSNEEGIAQNEEQEVTVERRGEALAVQVNCPCRKTFKIILS